MRKHRTGGRVVPCDACGKPTTRILSGPSDERFAECAACRNAHRAAYEAAWHSRDDDADGCDGCGEWVADGAPCADCAALALAD